MFAFCGFVLRVPVVGSFHTDIIDLLNNHGAYEFQKLCIVMKEYVDAITFDSCATTSKSFKVRYDAELSWLRTACIFCY